MTSALHLNIGDTVLYVYRAGVDHNVCSATLLEVQPDGDALLYKLRRQFTDLQLTVIADRVYPDTVAGYQAINEDYHD